MKTLIALLLAAAMLLTMTACGAAEPVETAPVTTEAPTTAPTEAPTQPRELTEEEKKQLYYEQMFADGTYVIDWSCVNIDVNTDYRVEQYSDENGIFWENLRTHADFPLFGASQYFRPDPNTAYYIYTPLEDGGTECYRLDSSVYQENTVSREVLATQLLFEDCVTQYREVWYVETVDGMDVVALDRGLLRGCLVHIDPATNEVKKLYIYDAETALNGGNIYYIEFVDKTVADITLLDNLPFSIQQWTSFDKIVDNRTQMIPYVKVYKIHNLEWKPHALVAPQQLPTHRFVEESAETKESKQLKWEQFFTNQEYVMDWNNVKIDYNANTHYEILTDENGTFWTMYGNGLDEFASYNVYYKDNNGEAYFYTTLKSNYKEAPRWFLVDTNSEVPARTKVNNVCAWEQNTFAEYLNNIRNIKYVKSVGGLDVVAVSATHYGYGDATLSFYMNPDTNEIKYVYTSYGKFEFMHYDSRADINMDNMDSICQIITYALSPTVILEMHAPETISKTITFADIERCNVIMYAMWHGHDTKEGANAMTTWKTESWITGEPFVPAN